MVLLIFVVAMMSALTACEDFKATAYKTLFIAGQSYDTGMKTVADLQKAGSITPEQRVVINKVAGKFYTTYQSAVSALAIYSKTNSAVDKDKLITLVSAVVNEYPIFVKNINSFAPGLLSNTLEVN